MHVMTIANRLETFPEDARVTSEHLVLGSLWTEDQALPRNAGDLLETLMLGEHPTGKFQVEVDDFVISVVDARFDLSPIDPEVTLIFRVKYKPLPMRQGASSKLLSRLFSYLSTEAN